MLQILDLSHNKLSGEIPSELNALGEMRELRMDHNRLSGFPAWLGSMKRLKIVHLNNNLLDGKVDLPLDMGDLDDLEEFAIENNDLTGVVGELMCDLLLDVLTSDCWGSSPQVDCPCCTKCY
jgi:Leucine-rich repeat (LRR) protein